MPVPDDVITRVLALRLGAQRNGVASDGRGWFRTDEQREECYEIARDLVADLHENGYRIVPVVLENTGKDSSDA